MNVIGEFWNYKWYELEPCPPDADPCALIGGWSADPILML